MITFDWGKAVVSREEVVDDYVIGRQEIIDAVVLVEEVTDCFKNLVSDGHLHAVVIGAVLDEIDVEEIESLHVQPLMEKTVNHRGGSRVIEQAVGLLAKDL